MKKIVLTIDNSFQMMPPIIGALKNINSPYHSKKNLPHPEILISSKWKELVKRIDTFLNTYDTYDKLVRTKFPRYPHSLPKNSFPNLEDVLNSYKNILYDSTELLEKLYTDLKACLLTEEEISKWSNPPKKWRDHPSIVCNRLKHNHNLLVPVEGYYQFGIVRGYGVCHYVNDCIIHNENIHPDKIPFSFGTDLRRILAHIYLAADWCTTQIKMTIPNSNASFQISPPRPEDEAFLQSVSSFMPLTFHHSNRSTNMPIFKYENQRLTICNTGGSIIPTGSGVISTIINGDGRTRTFSFF